MLTDDLPRIESLNCHVCGKPATHRILTPHGYAENGACLSHVAIIADDAHRAWRKEQAGSKEQLSLALHAIAASVMAAVEAGERYRGFPPAPQIVTEVIDG